MSGRHQGYQLPAHVLDRRVYQGDIELAAGFDLLPRHIQAARDHVRRLGPRPGSRRASSCRDGGARKTSSAPGTLLRTCLAPAMSISSRVGTPAATRWATGAFGVPYFRPANFAHSSNSPRAAIASKASSLTKWYSRLFTSPGRGDRVVTETDSQMSGRCARKRATTVLLPTPEGPERTVSRAGRDPPRTSAASHRRWTGESAVEPSSPRLPSGSSGSVRYHRRTRSPARCADWHPGREPGVIRRCRAAP